MKHIKKIVITLICIGVNFLCMQLVDLLHLPLFLNAIGTCFACANAGLIGGLICGIVSNAFIAPPGLITVFYCIAGAVTACVIYYCFKKEFLYKLLTTIVSGYWIGVVCAVLDTLISLKFQNGYVMNAWGDALIDMLRHYSWSKPMSALAGALLVEVVDKQLTLFIFLLVMQLASFYKNKRAKRDFSESAAKLFSLCAVACILFNSISLSVVNAMETDGTYIDNKGFASQIFTKKDGLLSSSVNAIAQTSDGYIWIGSDAGLLKYDGTNHESVFADRIPNVTVLYTDSKDRLFIGTADKGLAIYDNGELSFLTSANGLSSDTIRCIVEKAGCIYVGTSDKLCKIDIKDNIKVIDDSVTYAYKLTAVSDDYLAGCDWNGNLFVLDSNDNPIKIDDKLQNVYFTCVKKTSKGVFAGTSGSDLYTLSISDDLVSVKSKNDVEINGIHDICEGHEGRIWMCSGDALGYYDTYFRYRRRHIGDVNFTYDGLFIDYQNNIWVTSAKYGLMKLAESNFLYLSERGGVPNRAVNAAAKYAGLYFYGMDNGLWIHDRSNNSTIVNMLTERLDNVSIRAMMTDSKNRLLICTYNAEGLYIFDGKEIKTIGKAAGLTSNNCRNVIELSDGRIAVGTADGISIIKGDAVDRVITKKDGLSVSQILCLAEGEDGLLYAGTDGGGICVFDNGTMVKRYNTVESGLSSDVVLKMAPYDNGMLVSTSSQLCYIKDNVKVLSKYPYDNIYDIQVYSDDRAYILGEEGIADVSLASLLGGGNTEMYLYDDSNGLTPNVSSYAQNFIDSDGSLVFCTNMGVLAFSKIEKYSGYKYKYGITSLTCDGKAIQEENGVYNIPKDTKYVSIIASVRDYTLEDIRVRFYMEGKDGSYGNDVSHTMSYKRLVPISIYNPDAGQHKVHLQIFDGNENLIEEKTYILSREMRMWEYKWFKVYVVIVFVEAMMAFSASFILLYTYIRKKDELEKIQEGLQKSIEDKTQDLINQQMRTVMALSDAIDAKDRYTSGHSSRVAFYSKQIAARLGKSVEEQEEIYRAGLLHDIGKIRVPGSIISKPGKLTEDEYMLMKLHPVTGYHILKSIAGGDSLFAQGAHFHHERYDGRGYPNGLSGENIPEIARIIGVADAYDAMSSRRSYHDTFSQEYIRAELERGKGLQFDPVIADIMLQMMDEDNLYKMKESDDKKVVLVIDDKQKRIDEIRDIMKDESKYNVLGALSGEIGLSILEETKVDLVLLDMTMPGMDGEETLKRIRERYSMPVVFMVELEKLYTMQLASELGSDDFLTKPYVPMVLKEIVHNYTKTFDIFVN